MIAAILLMFGLVGLLKTVGWILNHGNNNRMTKLFIVCLISIILWIVSQLMILFSISDTQLLVSYLIGNAGICMFSPFWLMFSAEYSEASYNLKKIAGFMPIISVAMFCCIAANPLHKLYYSEFGKSGIEYGCLFYVFQLLFYIFIISGVSLMFVRHSKRSSIALNQSLLLALAVIVPLIINIFTVSGLINSKIELTPLFFAFSVIMVFIAIQRYGLLNINRMAIRDIIDNIDMAAIIFDADGNVTYKNKSAKLLIPENFTDYAGFEAEVDRLSRNAANCNYDSSELVIGEERYSIRKSRICNEKGTEIARIILISNISEYYELKEAEKKLSLEHERNRIAQEIHDSAGHTFTMISSLAKIMQMKVRNKNSDEPELLNYASEIDGLSRSGITQLRCSINNLRDDEFMTSVTRAVNTVTAAVRNMKTEICVQGTEDSRYSFCIREIYDTVKETVTNAMRYSSADRLDIIIKFLEDYLELYIFDNGMGCAEIKENNGLKGIRGRIEKIGGTVKFSSVEGEGFTTIVKVPIKN